MQTNLNFKMNYLTHFLLLATLFFGFNSCQKKPGVGGDAKINGKVSIYRPSSQKLDFEIPISLSSTNLLIPKSNLTGGLWDITVDWTCNGIDYLNKETIYF